MPSLILDNSHGRNPVIFFGRWCWEREAARDSSHTVTWRARTGDQQPVRNRGLAEFLEYVSRNPHKVTTIDEIPKLNDDDTAVAEWKDAHIAKLDAFIIFGLAQRKDAKMEIGRALNEQKRILGHGKFERHVSEVLGSMIKLRTAQRYMKLAKKQDAKSKNDNLSLLISGDDDGAKDVKNTTEIARDQVNSRLGKQPPIIAVYKLPLLLCSAERSAVDELRASPGWSEAHDSILLVLRRFCTNQGIEF
jgi:hypothetical protein